MTAALAFRVAAYLLALDGLLALHLAGLLGLMGTALAAATIAASWWKDRLRIPALTRLRRAMTVIIAAASAIDLLYLAASLLDGFVRLLLVLLLYRLFTRRWLRDARDVGFLAFFMLVAASSVMFDIAFLGIFLVFLVLGVWAFMLHHVLSEADRVGGPGALAVTNRGRLGPTLLGLALVASATTLAVTGVFFFIIPRVGQAALPLRAKLGAMVSGFSDRVELGAFGEIESDPSVVMRVRFPEGPAMPEMLPNLRWRGIAFDHFDGRSWKALRPRRSTLTRAAGGQFELRRYRGVGPFVTQEIYLEPIGTDVVFAAPRVLAVGLSAPSITVDDMDSVSVAIPSARLRYVAYSELEPGGRGGRNVEPPPPLDPDSRERYLQLPPLPPRIGELARRVGVGSDSPYDTALRLTRFLAGTYHYTLALSRRTDLEPIDEFLFVRRAGNCEYFASALAVMLRSIGIAARLVNGFQRGEWNPYGRYFMIRERDAHSWVEAYIDGVGWVTLDPSPRIPRAGTGLDRIALYLDALRLRWYRYVVNWSLRDQVTVAAALQHQTSAWRERFLAAHAAGDLPHLGPPAAALIGALVGGFLLWRRRGVRAARPLARVPRFYERALRALARRDLRLGPGETAREFLARVSVAAPACATPLSRVTAGYERARFGTASLPPADLAELESCVARLERPPRR